MTKRTRRIFNAGFKAKVALEALRERNTIDITYVPMRKGFMYLCTVIDVHTRFVLNWSVSNVMSSQWCRQVVQEAITNHGRPDIINPDQSVQFTSYEYISLLTELEDPVKISMDGKGNESKKQLSLSKILT